MAIGVAPVCPLYHSCFSRRYFPYCYYYCSFCLCCVGVSSFHLYRLSCPILAAAVLLLYYADAAETLLFFHNYFPLEPPPPVLLGSSPFPFRSDKLQTGPTFLPCGLLFTKICVFINIMAFSPVDEGWKLAALPLSRFHSPSPSPVPYPSYCTRLTCPLPLSNNLNNRKPRQNLHFMPAPAITFLPVPTPSRPLPRLSTRFSFPSY